MYGLSVVPENSHVSQPLRVFQPAVRRVTRIALFMGLLGCGAASSSQLVPTEPTDGASTESAGADTRAGAEPAAEVVVPAELRSAPLPHRVVARRLNNPRGMHPFPDGGLLVSEAGTGETAVPGSGALLRLRDNNGDGDFDDEGERETVLADQPSKNIFNIVRRDEVFGMAAIAEGDGVVLASLAFFGGPSTIYSVQGDKVSEWGSTHGNVNDLTYEPKGQRWYGVASTTDEIIRLLQGGLSERVIKFPTLPSGQDSVPGYVEHDPATGELLVTLFSGSPEGEEGGDGTELVPRAGGIVAVNPDKKTFRWVVAGLTVPTDLVVAPDGSIYVLEFCDAFLDPVTRREDMQGEAMHGGFRRFSGRLLHVDRQTGAVAVVATGLDQPTNMVLAGDRLYIAEGMGTPGRQIPTPSGPKPLEGFISSVDLSR